MRTKKKKYSQSRPTSSIFYLLSSDVPPPSPCTSLKRDIHFIRTRNRRRVVLGRFVINSPSLFFSRASLFFTVVDFLSEIFRSIMPNVIIEVRY